MAVLQPALEAGDPDGGESEGALAARHDPEGAARQVARLVADWLVGGDGRIISGSTSWYASEYQPHVMAFYANLLFPGADEPFWRGDLDLTRDEPRLRELAAVIGRSVCVTFEWRPGRRGRCVGVFHADGGVVLDPEVAVRHPIGIIVRPEWGSWPLLGLRPMPDSASWAFDESSWA